MESNKTKIFIGVAWPYVNGDLHIGHLAGYLLPADICARYHRATGHEVLMVSGSDCHGTPITIEADKTNKTPQEIVEEYHKKDVDLFLNTLDLTYDIYTRTDTPHHYKIVQDFFIKLLEAGYIFKDTTKQYYSSKQNRFLPDRYVQGTCPFCGYTEARSDQCDECGKLISEGVINNPISRLSNEPVELKETEHYFLDWSKLQPKIEKYVKVNGKNWKNWVFQETMGWLKEGLKPRAVTRDLDWGVPLPIERIPKDTVIENIANKRLYVWFDAVIGYYSASLLWAKEKHPAPPTVPRWVRGRRGVQGKNKDWRDFWYGENLRHYYFMGKDNLVFHTMFWPGKLVVYDPKLHLPDIQSINMFLNLAGKQFSKSRGISIDIKDIVEKFGNDPVRFYLTYIMPEKHDASFYWNDFYEKINSILVGNLGNFVHRVLSIAQNIDIKNVNDKKSLPKVQSHILQAFKKSRTSLEKCEFHNYLMTVLELSSFGNKLFDYEKVWEVKKSDPDRFAQMIKQFYLIILALGFLTSPLLPESSKKIFDLLGLEYESNWPEEGKEFKRLEEIINNIDTSIKPKPLFQKIVIK